MRFEPPSKRAWVVSFKAKYSNFFTEQCATLWCLIEDTANDKNMTDLSFGPLKFALSAITACLLLSTKQYTELIFLLDLMVQEDPPASYSFLHEKICIKIAFWIYYNCYSTFGSCTDIRINSNTVTFYFACQGLILG